MNNLKELSLQLNKLCNGDFVKVNIHLNINGSLLDLCEKINHEVNKHSFGLIYFGVENITVPHISIYMGYINSFEKFEFILQKTSEYAKKTKSFRVDPTQLYLKSVTNASLKYLFLDLLQNQKIIEQKKYFCNLFESQVKPIEWDFLNEPPHITLGCYEGISNMAVKQIEKYHEFPYCEIEDIGISISGNKGVCLGNLKSFKLENHNAI